MSFGLRAYLALLLLQRVPLDARVVLVGALHQLLDATCLLLALHLAQLLVLLVRVRVSVRVCVRVGVRVRG